MTEKYLFLDRDGVINYDKGYLYKSKNLFLYLDAVNLMHKSIKAGYKVHIFTNQSGIGRKYFSKEEFLIFMTDLKRILLSLGIKEISYSFCPHKPNENCACRKPKIGMYQEFSFDKVINLEKSIMIGDKKSDMQFGLNIGIKNLILVDRNKKFYRQNFDLPQKKYKLTNDLFEVDIS